MWDDDVLKWCARGFILVVFVVFLWLLFRKKTEYDFDGIKSFCTKKATAAIVPSFVTELIDESNLNSKKHKKKKRPKKFKTEEKCRKIIQKIYSKKFPSVRPDFLKSPVTKKNLELDCFNEEIGVALEYNGQQHYKFTPYFHKSKKNFYSQVHRDDWKRRKCRELGIKLIEIPYWVEPDALEDYIVGELRACGAL